MKNYLFALVFLFLGYGSAAAQEFLQVTAIESVVPGGLGRSRLITVGPDGQTLEEIELENFFSLVGINFKNIRTNDNLITQKLNQLTKQGWELVSVNSGSYSADKSTGIFITRYLFKRYGAATEGTDKK
jgi:hypothetical protein